MNNHQHSSTATSRPSSATTPRACCAKAKLSAPLWKHALREQIERRKVQKEFIARGLAARDAAKATGQYASKDDVMQSLKTRLNTARKNEYRAHRCELSRSVHARSKSVERLHSFLLEHDLNAAEKALDVIEQACLLEQISDFLSRN
jgi:predicted transcriptional regulator